jgi:hypothetical protein
MLLVAGFKVPAFTKELVPNLYEVGSWKEATNSA